MSGFNIAGLSSGIDTDGIIAKMMDAEKIPLTRLESEQTQVNDKLPLLSEINSKLLDLKLVMNDLTYETPFASKQATTSNTSVLKGSVNDLTATNGTYIIDSITKVATSTIATSAKNVGGFIDITRTMSHTIQKSLIGGTFTINGVSMVVDPSIDSVQNIIDNLNSPATQTATGVKASYDATNDRLVLQNINPGNKNVIMIGDPNNDTSNFLTAVGLNGAFQDVSSGTTVVNSSGHLGALNIAKNLSDSHFDKAATSGNIKINGVTIAIDASDTIVNTMNKINSSAAGVTLNYDSSLDKFQFISKNTGNSNIKFEEVAGGSNFLELAGVVGAKSTSAISGPLDAFTPLSNIKLTTPYTGNSVIKITGAVGSASININPADTINDVLIAINAQKSTTGVLAEFDDTKGTFKLKALDSFYTTPITAAYDAGNTGNFLDAFNLNGATSETTSYGYSVLKSSSDVGMIKLTDTLDKVNFKNAVDPGLPAGTLTITQGTFSKTINYDATAGTAMTVQDIITQINTHLPGEANVTAQFDSESGRIILKPDSNGDPNLVISDSNASPNNLMAALGLSTTNEIQKTGQNAEYKLNGTTYYANSNVVADKITGISFTLLGISTTATNLTIAGDTSAAKKSIEDFVTKYNDVLTLMDKEVKDEEGPLYRDNTLDDTINNLRAQINRYVENGLSSTAKSLSDIGITSGKVGMIFTKDYIGKLEIDSSKLDKALATNAMDVRKLFAYDSENGIKYSDGIAFHLNDALDSLTRLDGTYNSVIKLQTNHLSDIKKDIIQWNDRMKLMEDGLRSKFTAMETLMNQLKSQSSSLTQALSQLNSSSSGS